jgi:hypothetical protein
LSQLRTFTARTAIPVPAATPASGLFRTGFAVCEAVAADHDRNQACNLRDSAGEKALDGGALPGCVQLTRDESLMPDKAQQKYLTNRIFKSLHKPLTYLGVERTLFYFVCVGAVGPSIYSIPSLRVLLSSSAVSPSATGH